MKTLTRNEWIGVAVALFVAGAFLFFPGIFQQFTGLFSRKAPAAAAGVPAPTVTSAPEFLQ